MSHPLKDYDAIDRERREFKKKLKEFLAKEEELRKRMEEGLDVVERSGIVRELERIAKAVDACRRRIADAEVLIVGTHANDGMLGTEGSRDDELQARLDVANAKEELRQLLQEQRQAVERLTEAMAKVGSQVNVSPEDAEALRQAIEAAKQSIGSKGAAILKLEEELDHMKQQLKEHGDKGEVDKCGAQCKDPKYGLCDNPAVRNGRCWIPEHQAQ